jgi:hypothetical protein
MRNSLLPLKCGPGWQALFQYPHLSTCAFHQSWEHTPERNGRQPVVTVTRVPIGCVKKSDISLQPPSRI